MSKGKLTGQDPC